MPPDLESTDMVEGNAGIAGVAPIRPRNAAATEDLLVRNHDFQWGYDLEVDVTGADGETVLDERYYLQPGGSRSLFDVFDADEYEVRVVLDNRRTTTARVEVDDATDGVLVELGNGAVSVHDGLYE